MITKSAVFPLTTPNRLNINRSKPTNIHFGWQREQLEKNRGAWEVPLKLGEDVKWADKNLEFTPELVEKIYTRLNRNKDLDVAGFVVIPNIADFLKTEDSRNEFKGRLFDAVNDMYMKKNMKDYEPKYFEKRTFRQVDGSFEQPNGFVSASKFTLKRVHHDSHSIIGAHNYDQIQNVEGGSFLIIDDQQYAKDKGLKVEDLFELEEDKLNFPCSPVLKAEHADKLAAYTFPIDTIPQKGKSEDEGTRPSIIFFNNLDVAHGATQFRKLTEDGRRSYHRDFSRLSILAEKTNILFPFLPFHRPENHETL